MYFTVSTKKPSRKKTKNEANTEIKTLYNKSSASSEFCFASFLQRHGVTGSSRVRLLVIERRVVESCPGGVGGAVSGSGGPRLFIDFTFYFYLSLSPAAPVRVAGCSPRLTRSVSVRELSKSVNR